MDEQKPSCCPDSAPCACSSNPLRWLWMVIIVAVVIFVITRSRQQPADEIASDAGSGIVWQEDYQKAMDQARQENKPVLLAFHASWCGPCKQMKNTTYRDPGVVKLSESFIRVMIDVDKSEKLSEKYQIQGIPAYKILKSDGSISADFSGSRSAKEFAAELEMGLKKYNGTPE